MKKEKSIYEFNSYKTAMEFYLMGEANWGMLSKAALALNCQKSYLSRVIKEKLHLTPDHAYKLAQFLKFNPMDCDYFLLLLDVERATDQTYIKYLKSRLFEIKQKHDSIQGRTQRDSLVTHSTNTFQLNYFSSWIWSAIHFLTSIPEYQNEEALMGRLGLTKPMLSMYLEKLNEVGFIEFKNGKCKYLSGEFHEPKNNPLELLHHQNWRQRALLDTQNYGSTNSVHFTAVQTVSFKDLAEIKELLLRFLSDSSRIAGPSKPEEAMVLNCDLFTV